MRADVTFGEFVPIIAFVVTVGVMFLLRRNATKKQIQKKSRYFTNVTYNINNSFFKKQEKDLKTLITGKKFTR
jgi:uncharacterized membrane protein